jgi:hypothetical protein
MRGTETAAIRVEEVDAVSHAAVGRVVAIEG